MNKSLKVKLLDEIYNEYFECMPRHAFNEIMDYDYAYSIIYNLVFNKGGSIHINICNSMLEFLSAVNDAGDICNNSDGQLYIAYKEDNEEYIYHEINDGMNTGECSLQEQVLQRIDTTEMIVIVRTLNNNCHRDSRIDILYICVDEKLETINADKYLSKNDLDKLNSTINNRLETSIFNTVYSRFKDAISGDKRIEHLNPGSVEKGLVNVSKNIANYAANCGHSVNEFYTMLVTMDEVMSYKDLLSEKFNIKDKENIRYAGPIGCCCNRKIINSDTVDVVAPLNVPTVFYYLNAKERILFSYILFPSKEIIDEQNSNVQENSPSPVWPDKIAEALLEAIIVRNIKDKAYVEFPDRYSKVAKNIVNTVEIPYGNSIDKDYLGIQVHICTKFGFKSAISDSHTCVKYAGNLGSDDDSDLYDPEVNYTYSATDIYLNEVLPYSPVFYNSDYITSKDGIPSSNINIYILRKSIVAEED